MQTNIISYYSYSLDSRPERTNIYIQYIFIPHVCGAVQRYHENRENWRTIANRIGTMLDPYELRGVICTAITLLVIITKPWAEAKKKYFFYGLCGQRALQLCYWMFYEDEHWLYLNILLAYSYLIGVYSVHVFPYKRKTDTHVSIKTCEFTSNYFTWVIFGIVNKTGCIWNDGKLT